MAFVAGVLLLPGLFILAISRHYRSSGERRKSGEVVRHFLYGVVTAVGISIAYASCGK